MKLWKMIQVRIIKKKLKLITVEWRIGLCVWVSDQDGANMIFVSIGNYEKPEIIKAKKQELENFSAFDGYKEV